VPLHLLFLIRAEKLNDLKSDEIIVTGKQQIQRGCSSGGATAAYGGQENSSVY
jgi:hypothetical protein